MGLSLCVHKIGTARKSCEKQKKTTAFQLESGGFMVAGGGLEPPTSGL